MTWRRALAWTMGIVGPVMAITGGFVFPMGDGFAPELGIWGQVIPVLVSLTYALVGGLIIHRHPTHLIGWLLIWFAFSFGVGVFVDDYSYQPRLPGQRWVAWWSGFGFFTGVIPLITLIPLLFPNGRPPSPRWAPVAWGIVGGVLVLVVANAFDPDLLESHGLDNPMGVEAFRPLVAPLNALGMVIVGAGLLAALTAVTMRYRRSRGEERQQMKWFIMGSSLTVASAIGLALLYQSGGLGIGLMLFAIGSLALPLSIGIAILRYRLYDIDRIISRTVTYGLVVALLGLVVLGLVAGMAIFLPSDDPLVVAVATLAVFALFNPVRLRVQRVVDRRFNRSRYDAARVIEHFTGSLQDRVDPEGVLDDWMGVVEETMQPGMVGVWVR